MSNDTKLWEAIAAPIPASDVQWRIDGKPSERQGKYFARYVAYVDAQFVRERLDSTVSGNWDLTLELLPSVDVVNRDGVVTGRECSFKARLQILGVIREDVGTGDDYKSASSDAFKRAAVRFGVAHELYSFEQNWVEVDGDGKFAKPVEDPQKAYERRHQSSVSSGAKSAAGTKPSPVPREGAASEQTGGQTRSSSKSPADKPMPFGKTKGKKLGELGDTELEKTADWCRTTDAAKFKDLIGDIESVLDSRSSRATVPADDDSFPNALREQDDDLPF